MTRKALGKGLEALIPGNEAEGGRVAAIPVERISRNRYQPRKHFDREKIEELAKSFRTSGILQPVLLREAEETH